MNGIAKFVIYGMIVSYIFTYCMIEYIVSEIYFNIIFYNEPTQKKKRRASVDTFLTIVHNLPLHPWWVSVCMSMKLNEMTWIWVQNIYIYILK